MKRIQMFLVIVFFGAAFSGCSDDADDLDIDPVNVALYDLTLINGTDSEIEIFFLGNEVGAEFERKGLLASGQELIISNLVIRETYVVGAADPGGTLQEFFYEQTLNRTSPTDVTLTITR